MNTINALQVSFLLNISKEAAFSRTMKHLGKEEELNQLRMDLDEENNRRRKQGKAEKNLSAAKCREIEVDIDAFSVSQELDFRSLLKSMNDDFTKSWECTQYLLTKMKKKYKPAPSGFYPLALTIPTEISSLLDSDGQEKVLEYMKRNCVARNMRDKNGNALTVTYKI